MPDINGSSPNHLGKSGQGVEDSSVCFTRPLDPLNPYYRSINLELIHIVINTFRSRDPCVTPLFVIPGLIRNLGNV